jgi:hypothetical protein
MIGVLILFVILPHNFDLKKMSIFRILLFILFVCNCNINFASISSSATNTATTIQESLDSGIGNKFFTLAETINLSLERSFPNYIGIPSKIVYQTVKDKYQFLCQHKNKIALLYVTTGDIIVLKFNSCSISYPFHYFP